MDKAHIGSILEKKNLGGNIQETTKMIRKMEEELCSIPIKIDMMECG